MAFGGNNEMRYGFRQTVSSAGAGQITLEHSSEIEAVFTDIFASAPTKKV